MGQDAWIMLFVGIAITSVLFVTGIILHLKLKSEKQDFTLDAKIEAALLPFIFEGIFAAYRLNNQSFDMVQRPISDTDMKKIIDSVYCLLPEKIDSFEILLIKRVVSQERFATLAQNALNNSNRFFIEHQEHFDNLFEKWKAYAL
jgi:hypothetical protein